MAVPPALSISATTARPALFVAIDNADFCALGRE
jgi:hypothetical protein